MQKQNINAFEDLSVPKALAKFVIPSVISQLTMLILNLTDAFFVGRTENTFQISAMTITFPIVMMIGCIATIFAAGGNANIAAALGTNNKESLSYLMRVMSCGELKLRIPFPLLFHSCVVTVD